MKARATTLTIGIAMTLALIAPAAQAAVILGGGAAASPSALTVKANTNHRATNHLDTRTTESGPNYLALKERI
jgi:hypothetical protein